MKLYLLFFGAYVTIQLMFITCHLYAMLFYCFIVCLIKKNTSSTLVLYVKSMYITHEMRYGFLMCMTQLGHIGGMGTCEVMTLRTG